MTHVSVCPDCGQSFSYTGAPDMPYPGCPHCKQEKETMKRTIVTIGPVFGTSPGMVEVTTCYIDEQGRRGGFETHRVPLTWDVPMTGDVAQARRIRRYVCRELNAEMEV